MEKIQFFLVTLTLLSAALFNVNCTPSDTSSVLPKIISTEGTAAIGKPAPVFTWLGPDNIKHTLTDYRGKLILIATWDLQCNLCLEFVLPYLAENYKRFSDQGVVILAINDMDSEKVLTPYLNSKNYPFTVLKDEKNPEFKFRSPYLLKMGNPHIVLIDRNGILVDKTWPLSSEAVTNLIENFVKSQ